MRLKTLKKAIGLLITAALVVTMIPASAFAASGACNDGNACTKHAAAIGNIHYDTVNEAIKAVKTGEEIVLLKDAKEVLTIAKPNVNFTLNLNNHAVDSTTVDKYDVVKLYGDNLGLTIKNGKLLNSNATAYGIYAYSKDKTHGYDTLKLVIDNVTIDTGDQPLGVQGMNANQNVTVKNSTIKTSTTAIYFPPKSGTLKVENTTINAVNNGIVVKGGDVVVSGNTKISVTGVPEKKDDPYTGDPTGNGFPKTGNAIYVEGGYKVANATERPISVKILDGHFNSMYGEAVAVNHIRDPKTQGALIAGGSFSSDVSQFANENKTVAALTSGELTTYYIGSSEEVANKIVGLAQDQDVVNIKKGSVDFNGLADGVLVSKEDTAGEVTVNGNAVGKEPVVVHNHKWSEPVWSWSKDYSEATAKFTCKDDATHVHTVTVKSKSVVTDATADKEGKIVYTATVEFNGKTYTDTKTVTTPVKPDGAETPQTGDSNAMASVMSLIALAGLTVVLIRKRKEMN